VGGGPFNPQEKFFLGRPIGKALFFWGKKGGGGLAGSKLGGTVLGATGWAIFFVGRAPKKGGGGFWGANRRAQHKTTNGGRFAAIPIQPRFGGGHQKKHPPKAVFREKLREGGDREGRAP